jgi:anti-sigma regulatory factor (Ser/Thr protein kinase)
MGGTGTRSGGGIGVVGDAGIGNGSSRMTDLTLSLAPVPDSVPTARRTLDRLSARLDGRQLEDLRLLVSEVVSNSVRHGEGTGPIQLRVTIEPSSVRVEVEDPGPGFQPAPELDPPGRHDGWGLLLVDRLSARWGVVAGASTVVWFEIDRRSA